jgi:hypothetical protein
MTDYLPEEQNSIVREFLNLTKPRLTKDKRGARIKTHPFFKEGPPDEDFGIIDPDYGF